MHIYQSEVPAGLGRLFFKLSLPGFLWGSFFFQLWLPSGLLSPPSILCSSALTAPDSWRWNRNFDIKHLHKGGLTFDQRAVWCCDIKFASWEPWQRTLPQKGVMPEPCQGAAKVKGLLGRNKPSNPTQGPCKAFDVQCTEIEWKIEPWEKSKDIKRLFRISRWVNRIGRAL